MPAPALLCKAVLAQASAKWPDRDKRSDGIMSSDYHKKQNPFSGHDYGNAVDLTHDPEHGCDAHAWAEWLVERQFPWVKYVISNNRIWSLKRRAEGWRPYYGVNPHVKHVHVEIDPNYRDTIPTWFPAIKVAHSHSNVKLPHISVGGDIVSQLPVLEIGKVGNAADVYTLQGLLNARYGKVVLAFDGIFGKNTDRVVKAYQKLVGLEPDGIVGPKTWRKLLRV